MASKTDEGESAQDFLEEQGELFAKGFSFSGYERDLLALNRGDGRFVDASGVSGIDSVGDGRGAVFADFDDDGDTDVFLRAMHGPAHLLFRNEVGAEAGNWVRVQLRGTDSGSDAFGAVVRLRAGGGVQAKVVDGGSGFLSQADRRLLFGLGEATAAEALEVAWPSGLRQSFPGPKAGQSWLIVEGEEKARPVAETPARLGGRGEGWAALPGLRRDEPLPALGLSKGAAATAIAKADGRPLLVSFFATWCATCRRELPELQAAAREAGVRLVGVSVDAPESAGRVSAFLESLGVTYPVAVADHEAAKRLFGERVSLPAVVLLDGESRRVREATVGGSRSALLALVERARGEE